ncbi:MAG: hypothetical protein D6715_05935 [Calditrichaeota bacterium]|nr:MAG: hypothetical protein D6715_05935 [Calditrichota bacterium]
MKRVSAGLFPVLLAGLLISCGGGYKLAGKVENPAFEPIAGARVVLHYSGKRDSLVAQSDATGNFELQKIKERQVQIRITAEHYLPFLGTVEFTNPVLSRTFRLPYRQTRILGRVIDAQSGEPISNVRISIPDRHLNAFSDVDGRFVLTGPTLEAGYYQLQFTANGYRTEFKVAEVEEARDKNLGDVALTRLASRARARDRVEEEQAYRVKTEDTETTQNLSGYGTDPLVQRFLEENETFTLIQFRRLFSAAQLTPQQVQENLNIYIQRKLIEPIDANTFRSLVYQRRFSKPAKDKQAP